jgi:hypothetical protein
MTGDGTTSDKTGGSAPTVQLASAPAEDYLHGVRAALADLPAPEVAEILDDVRAHLTDLTAELGGEVDTVTLVARLGTPQAYAAELRAAAGYPSAPEQAARPRSGTARLALAGLVASTLLLLLGIAAADPGFILVAILIGVVGLAVIWRDGPRIPGVAALPEVRRALAERAAPGTTARTTVDFLASLQPAWWVARAFVAAAVVVGVFGGGGAAAGIVVALLAVPVSIWVGHRTRRDQRWLWPVVPLNALAAALLLVLIGSGTSGVFGSPTPVSSPAVYQSGLWQDGEREILDIHPFDAAGNPLTGVYLFDQDGRAVDTSAGAECDDGYESLSTADRIDPYPRGTREYDHRTGRCHVTPPGPLVVAVPAPPTSGVPTAAPTAVAPPTDAPIPPTTVPAQPTPPAVPPTG